MKCHICENPSVYIFHSKVLLKYDVSYFQCSNCGFIQTEEPYWLNEAYADAISLLDVGLVERNIYLSKLLSPILKQYFNYKAKFLDYAGGYGLFVRLMRDQGFNYYRKDPYCENIFAKCFDYEDLPRPVRFELLTAFEVFEHLTAPMEGLNNMLEHTDNILFSTELQPAMDIKSVTDWQYFVPETGQHIAFYTHHSLQLMAAACACHLYSNHTNLHLFTRIKLSSDPFVSKNIFLRRAKNKLFSILNPASRRMGLHSLRQNDYNYLLQKFYINNSDHQ